VTLLSNGSTVRDDDPGEPSTGKPRVSVTEDEARILARLATGAIVLELGTGLGVSTRAMACTAEWLTTVDPDPWVHDHIWPMLDDVACEEQAPAVGQGNQLTFNMVFIDADHTSEAVEQDVHYARSAVESPGLIVCHDANYDNVKTGLARAGGTWVTINTTHGLALQWV
jgi:predicted O-methyltransferase YrrM